MTSKPKSFVPVDSRRPGFKWSFDNTRPGNNKSKLTHGQQIRNQPYTNPKLEIVDKPTSTPTPHPLNILPPQIPRGFKPPNTKLADEKKIEHDLKNPLPTPDQVMQKERDGIEMRKNRQVDVSRGLLSLKYATSRKLTKSVPLDVEDEEYRSRMRDSSKIERKNHSAAFLKAFFDQANMIAQNGGSADSNLAESRKRKRKRRRDEANTECI